MRRYRHILAVIEPGSDKNTALTRALEIANFSPDVRITAMIAVYDFSNELTSVLDISTQLELKNRLIKVNEQMIDQELKKIDAHVDIETKIIWQRSITRAIVDEINHGDYDLLIKSANNSEHDLLHTLLVAPLDLKLLRHSPIPVIVAKEHDWEKNAAIVVTLNFEDHSDHNLYRMMNITLLRHAQVLAKMTGASIHLVNAAVPINQSTLIEMPGFSPDLYSEALYTHNNDKMEAFAKKHKIPAENCHISIGQAGDVIAHYAQELNANTVLVGNFARSGIIGTLVGNICEQIGDELKCDMFVINAPHKNE